MLKMNLQYFAEDEIIDETVVNEPDDEVVDDETLTDDEGNETEDEIQDETIDEDDLPELPDNQKNAFQKRLEREQKKLKEQLENEMKSKYSKHEKIIDSLGGLDTVEKALQEQQWLQEAQNEGYDESQTQTYINSRRTEEKLFELEIKDQVNELRDNPTYQGISTMKNEITQLVKRSNGALTVEQAYWALGGSQRAEQTKREIEQREVARRSKARSTVQSDSSVSTAGEEKPLPKDIQEQARKMGISEKEARELLNFNINNLEDFRKSKKG